MILGAKLNLRQTLHCESMTNLNLSTMSTTLDYPQRNWLTHFYIPSNPQEIQAEIVKVITKNQNYFTKCLVYLQSDKLLTQVHNLLEQNISLKLSIVVINSSHNEMQRQTKFIESALKDCKVILTSVDVKKSFKSQKIDIQNINLIINSRLPSNRQEYYKKVEQSNRLSQRSKGVVINFMQGKYDKYFKRFSADRRQIRNLEAKLQIRLSEYNQYTQLSYYIKNSQGLVTSRKLKGKLAESNYFSNGSGDQQNQIIKQQEKGGQKLFKKVKNDETSKRQTTANSMRQEVIKPAVKLEKYINGAEGYKTEKAEQKNYKIVGVNSVKNGERNRDKVQIKQIEIRQDPPNSLGQAHQPNKEFKNISLINLLNSKENDQHILSKSIILQQTKKQKAKAKQNKIKQQDPSKLLQTQLKTSPRYQQPLQNPQQNTSLTQQVFNKVADVEKSTIELRSDIKNIGSQLKMIMEKLCQAQLNSTLSFNTQLNKVAETVLARIQKSEKLVEQKLQRQEKKIRQEIKDISDSGCERVKENMEKLFIGIEGKVKELKMVNESREQGQLNRKKMIENNNLQARIVQLQNKALIKQSELSKCKKQISQLTAERQLKLEQNKKLREQIALFSNTLPLKLAVNPTLFSELESISSEGRQFLEKSLRQLFPTTTYIGINKILESTQNQDYNTWLQKVYNKKNLLVLLWLEYAQIIGGFSQDLLINPSEGLQQKGNAFLFSVTNKKVYPLSLQNTGRSLKFDRYYFTFGNNELMIKSNEMKYSVIFNKAFVYFKTKDKEIEDFLGKNNNEGKYKKVEFYQISVEPHQKVRM